MLSELKWYLDYLLLPYLALNSIFDYSIFDYSIFDFAIAAYNMYVTVAVPFFTLKMTEKVVKDIYTLTAAKNV